MKKIIATLATIGTVALTPLSALAAPQLMPDGAIFDAEYYAQNYPDVVSALGTDADALYQHYLVAGKNEGRLPYAPESITNLDLFENFESEYYTSLYPDVVAVYGTEPVALYQHYINYGKAEGRYPNAISDVNFEAPSGSSSGSNSGSSSGSGSLKNGGEYPDDGLDWGPLICIGP